MYRSEEVTIDLILIKDLRKSSIFPQLLNSLLHSQKLGQWRSGGCLWCLPSNSTQSRPWMHLPSGDDVVGKSSLKVTSVCIFFLFSRDEDDFDELGSEDSSPGDREWIWFQKQLALLPCDTGASIAFCMYFPFQYFQQEEWSCELLF